MLKVKDSCCSFQDLPAAGLLLTDLQGRERYTKYGAADLTLLGIPSLSQHRHFHFRPGRAPQVEILLWRLSKPAILQVATFLPQRLSCLFERVEQDLSQLPSLIYQQKSNHYFYAEHKSTCVSCLHPSSLVQIKIQFCSFVVSLWMAVKSSSSAMLTSARSCPQSSPLMPFMVSPHHMACTQGQHAPGPSTLAALLSSHPHNLVLYYVAGVQSSLAVCTLNHSSRLLTSHNVQYPFLLPQQGALKTPLRMMLDCVIPLVLGFLSPSCLP